MTYESPNSPASEELARSRVRDELDRRAADKAWLARVAELDYATVRDFVEGDRWPRRTTLAKIESVFGWVPGTLDRIAHGMPVEPVPGVVDAAALRALLGALDEQVHQATDEWVSATLRSRESGLAVEAAEKKRAQLIAERIRLTDELEMIDRAERRSDGEVPTMPARRATDPEDADYSDVRGGA